MEVKWLSLLTQQLSEFSNHSLGQCFPARFCNAPECLMFPKEFHEILKKKIQLKTNTGQIISFRHDQEKNVTDIHHNLAKCGKLHSLVIHHSAGKSYEKEGRIYHRMTMLPIIKDNFALCSHLI